MAAIKPEDLAIAAHTEQLAEISKVIPELLKLKGANESVDFLDSLLKTMSIKIEFSDEDLKKIPKEGGFIAVANHPYGGIDGIVLLKLLAEARPEIKLMVNSITEKITQAYFIAVNPFEEPENEPNLTGIKEVLSHLQAGAAIAMFPAGGAADYNLKNKRIMDKQWLPLSGEIINKAEVPVLPVYLKENNSLLFQMASMIHPKFRSARLPLEFLRKIRKRIQVKIGDPIAVEEIKAFQNPQQSLNYIRARTDALGMEIDGQQINVLKRRQLETENKEVSPSAGLDEIIDEIMAVQDCQIIKEGPYEIYNCPAYRIPHILNEIGHQRAITLRGTDEESGKVTDLNQYDMYYNHLFIWHRPERKIIGAFRLGIGKEILANRSHQAFYTTELFKVEEGFHPIINGGIELGCEWIAKEFQPESLPRLLLWRSLLQIINRDPDIHYLFGPTRISNKHSEFRLIAEFIKKHYYNDELAQYISSYKAFEAGEANKEEADNFDTITGDKIHKNVPAPLRQYFAKHGQMVGFFTDSELSDSLKGLLIVDVKNVSQDLIDVQEAL